MKFFKTSEFNIKDKVGQFYVYQREIIKKINSKHIIKFDPVSRF